MKILIVGKGRIAESLNDLALDDVCTFNYSIRDLISKPFLLNDFKSEIKTADVIIYLGYHHRSLFGNCIFLLKTLVFLNKIKWSGGVIFFNTQSALSERIIKKKKQDLSKFNFEIYSVTKKIQSVMLAYFEKKITIFELFLPVVVGKDSNADNFFSKLSEFEKITFPNKGKNKIAILGVELFSNWLWKEIQDFINKGNTQLERKLFVYETISTPEKLLRIKYEEMGRNSDTVTFCDINLRYEYSNLILSELKYKLKKSLIGLILTILKDYFHSGSELIVYKNVENVDDLKKLNYVVNGDEYFFYSREIFLELIPFNVVKISR